MCVFECKYLTRTILSDLLILMYFYDLTIVAACLTTFTGD